MRDEYFITGSGGFYAKTYDEKAPMNAIIRGTVGVWYSPEGILVSHGGAIAAPTQLAGDIAFPFGDGYGVIGAGRNNSFGNASKFVGNAALFVSNNEVKILDPSLSASVITIPFTGLTAGVPYVAPYRGSGQFRTPVPIGVAEQIDAPSLIQPLTIGTGFTGLNNGLYAMRMSYIRTFTGGESLTSPTSNSLNVTNSSILIQFPEPTQGRYVDNSTLAWDTNDVWRLYPTPKNFGNTTVFVFLKDVPERRVASETYGAWTSAVTGSDTEVTLTTDVLTSLFTVTELQTWLIGKTVTFSTTDVAKIIDVTALNKFVVSGTLASGSSGTSLTIKSLVDGFSDERLLEAEWSENDLSDLIPPTNAFTPNTTAKFVVPLVNTVLLVGTDGGQSIACSVQNFYESYPPTFRMVLPETPVGVSYKPEDAFAYIMCKDSTHEARWTGASDGAPVALRKVSNKGTAHQKSFTVVDGVIFSYTSDKRIVMISPNGETDMRFSMPVQGLISQWIPELVTVAYDERYNAVVFFHRDEFISYHIGLGVWGSLITWTQFKSPDSDIPNNDIITAISNKGIITIFDVAIRVIGSTGTTTTNVYQSGALSTFVGTDVGKAIFFQLSDGSTHTATITAVTGFGANAQVDSLPTNFQSQTGVYAEVVDGTPTAFYFDRSPDENADSIITQASVKYQWNHFDNQLYGKTINGASVIASNTSSANLKFGADGDSGAFSETFPVTFGSNKFVSDPVDINVGIGRLITTFIEVDNADRVEFHGIRLEFTVHKMHSVY